MAVIVSSLSLGFEVALAMKTTHSYIYIVLGLFNVSQLVIAGFVLFEKLYPDQISSRLSWLIGSIGANVIMLIISASLSSAKRAKQSKEWIDLTGLGVVMYLGLFGIIKLIILIALITIKGRIGSMFEYEDERIKLIEN